MLVPFLIMMREGIEAALIVGLVASYLKQTGRERWTPAVWSGVGGGRPLRHCFRWRAVFILFVAAGLLAGSVRALHEAGLWNGLQNIAFDASGVFPADGVLGSVLSGLLGYHDTPAIGEVLAYLVF